MRDCKTVSVTCTARSISIQFSNRKLTGSSAPCMIIGECCSLATATHLLPDGNTYHIEAAAVASYRNVLLV